jgi:hypothetical protein
MGPPPWSLRKTDAHDCIMVPDSDESTAYKFAGRNYARARREAPLGIAALTRPPCNEKLCPLNRSIGIRRDESKLWLDINRPIQVPTFGGRFQRIQILRFPKMLESAKLG